MPIGRGALRIVQEEDGARAASAGAIAASSMCRTRRLPSGLAGTATTASGLAFNHAPRRRKSSHSSTAFPSATVAAEAGTPLRSSSLRAKVSQGGKIPSSTRRPGRCPMRRTRCEGSPRQKSAAARNPWEPKTPRSLPRSAKSSPCRSAVSRPGSTPVHRTAIHAPARSPPRFPAPSPIASDGGRKERMRPIIGNGSATILLLLHEYSLFLPPLPGLAFRQRPPELLDAFVRDARAMNAQLLQVGQRFDGVQPRVRNRGSFKRK